MPLIGPIYPQTLMVMNEGQFFVDFPFKAWIKLTVSIRRVSAVSHGDGVAILTLKESVKFVFFQLTSQAGVI